eukprot:g5753.t1
MKKWHLFHNFASHQLHMGSQQSTQGISCPSCDDPTVRMHDPPGYSEYKVWVCMSCGWNVPTNEWEPGMPLPQGDR